MEHQHSYPKNKIKFLLLENIHAAACEALGAAGYNVKEVGKALDSQELLQEIEDTHVLGIRSKTKVTAEHIARAKKLLAIGCFGVGTNQVDLKAAAKAGIPVFNAPYSSTRSVAELALGDILMLARHAGDVNNKMHAGRWEKSAKGSFEIRNKTLGLIGYGHIGQQVGLLAESVGMKVIFYDVTKRLPLGNAVPTEHFDELLARADFLSLHVPAQAGGKALLAEKELAKMKKGACLINLSRGSLVDLNALRAALESGALRGAALDVFPDEPESNNADFSCPLAGVKNVVMTPHIGGSTEEAQRNIGLEVADAFIKFIDAGVSVGAVNFPQVALPAFPESHRILYIHKNVPGAALEINSVVSGIGANINAQYLSTQGDVGYMIMDLDKALATEVKDRIASLPNNIRTRLLF